MDSYLFIGGPNDGELIDVRSDLTQVRFFRGRHELGTEIIWNTYDARLITDGKGKIHQVFVHKSVDDLIEVLIKGYRRPRETT